jgi:hypothetical protein
MVKRILMFLPKAPYIVGSTDRGSVSLADYPCEARTCHRFSRKLKTNAAMPPDSFFILMEEEIHFNLELKVLRINIY